MNRLVLVTGASGRIARVVIPHLVANGLSVLAGTRDGAGDTVALGDLGQASEADLERALAGVGAVLHLAGVAHRRADPDAIARVNLEGTARVARAAARADVTRFVFASTIYAASAPGRDTPFEATTRDAASGAYGKAKQQAEAAIAAEFKGERLILRLAPVLIGPPAGSLGLLWRLARSGLPLPFGSLDNARSLVSPSTLADTMLAALRSDVTGVVPVADAEPVLVRDLARAFQKAAGVRAGLLPVPRAVLRRLLALTGGEERAAALCDPFIVSTAALKHLGVVPAPRTLESVAAYVAARPAG